ncbi:hypothetical protein [Ruminiclostridium papyrosolvens]|uniref:Virulence-related protein n=1 Tax=Ruminiclostridium papyrosolvens C7 TaxID=1330534 RepID=U4QX27_9FIRM|nr:hypothetical protein [Ruminiclostridium papyrosolvens]EPR08118.1 hypothetical protein L323_18525 [Ruminiclostridium papyrosolvens C7]
MDRKEIIKALEKHFEVKAKYMGAPSFAYQIEGPEEILMIDRVGRITTEDGTVVELERLLNGPKMTAVNEAVNETEILELEVALPMEGHTGVTLRNLVNMIYSKQILIKKAFDAETDIVSTDFISNINKTEIQTLEDFQKALHDHGQGCCRGLEFDFNNRNITFKFAGNLQEPHKLQAYTYFVSLLSNSAKELKYALPKATDTDNEKFTMRTWLIRLGLKGKEYKKAREVILQNLSGNGAFRNTKTAGEYFS